MRLRIAIRAAAIHFVGSLLLAGLSALLVFLIWYPHPYELLSGGRELFLILVGVDVICGPLLTLVLFNPKKPSRELATDMFLVVLIQLGALVYGMHTAYVARPLFLVHEVDRFRVVSRPDLELRGTDEALAGLDADLAPHWTSGPLTVGIRPPKDEAERKTVLLEAVAGGRDYSQRPEFYMAYSPSYAANVLKRTRPLTAFVDRYPLLKGEAQRLMDSRKLLISDALFLPVIHRQEWVAVLDQGAAIIGFLPGDGFAVPPSSGKHD